MAEPVSYTDVLKDSSGFSFTGDMARFSFHPDMVDGYKAISDETVLKNDFTSMWESIKVSSEEAGNEIYTKIKDYINEIGNIDTCSLAALANYAKITSTDHEVLIGKSFPKEIQNLIEIFSVNTAYLYNKATDGSESSLALKNTILSNTTIEKFLSSFKNKDDYRNMIRDVFYNTILGFVNMKVGCFDDSNVVNGDVEIWKTDINRFKNRLWEFDVVSEQTVLELKKSLSVKNSFTEKIYADDIISGKRKLNDFSETEQTVILAEMESRQSRYGNASQMKYYFMRLYKVMEYFRFISLTINSVYELEKYDLSESKFSISDTKAVSNLIVSDYGDYKIDTNVIYSVSKWLADYCIDVLKLRNRVKIQCQRNMMNGTKKLLVDLIRELILENIDKDTWNKFRNTTIYAAGLNKNFKVKLVEYLDSTEYFNVQNPTDTVNASENGLNQRYWENDFGSNKALSNSEILSFYNRLVDDAKSFSENENNGDGNSSNLYEFLSALFECGATRNSNSDATDAGKSYSTTGGSDVELTSTTALTGDALEAFKKYSGDPDIGDTPWINSKNSFHPSFQIHPFLNGFEEYTSAYTGIMNLVNSFSDDITTSVSRLTDRIDSLGNTINFWYNWNEDFTGYSTNFEKGGSDADIKKNQDGPFNFDALNEFLTLPDEYILNILSNSNEYYLDASTKKPFLNETETKLEVSRLKKFKDRIKSLTSKSVCGYGKDRYGNIFVLYKPTEDAEKRDSLGEIWVRLNNHPIAFPLFDITDSNEVYTTISCLTESNNQKLNDTIKFIVNRFESTYGVKGSDNRTVVSNNLSLTFGTCSKSAYVTRDTEGKPVHPSLEPTAASEFDFGTVAMKAIECNNGALTTFFSKCHFKYSDKFVDISNLANILELSTEVTNMKAVSSTDYFVDNITNTSIMDMMSVSAYDITTGEYTEVENKYGKVIDKPSDTFFKATYANGKLNIRPSLASQNYVIFSDYDDVLESDPNITFFYTNESGVVHPCSKHTINIKSVYAMSDSKLTANIAEDGTASFGELTTTTTSTSAEEIESVVDGSVVMEDFDSYTYSFFNPFTESTSGYKYSIEHSESKKMVFIGGNNPYFVLDDLDEDGNHYTRLLKATRVKRADEKDTFIYTDSDLYREASNYGTESYKTDYFKLDDCEFTVPVDEERVFDTTRQFYAKNTPYKFYHPYTGITEPTTDVNTLSTSAATGCVSFSDIKGGGKTTFYYNIVPNTQEGTNYELRSKTIKTKVFKDTVTTNLVKLGGGFKFISDNVNDYPIEITFANTDSAYNTASYSTMYGEGDFVKFFDIGFSYDQKKMFMSYRNGSESVYDSGMLIVDVSEKIDNDFTHSLTFSRETSHNMENTEPSMLNDHTLMSENAIPKMYEVMPKIVYSGCNSFVTYDSMNEVMKLDSSSEKVKAFRNLVGFKDSDFWYASALEFAAISGDILAEDPDAFVTKYTSSGEVEKATKFYTISGSPSTTYGENGHFITDSISRMFSGYDSETYAASGDCKNAYANITDSEVETIIGKMGDEISDRLYSDNLTPIHLGDCVSKSGVFSVYGRYNDRTGMMSMTMYLFTNNDVKTHNFEISLKFSPYDFGTENTEGRYSYKTVCTETRLYVAFTCNPPSDDFIITNGVNAGVTGVGSTTYGSIKKNGDSIVTILSFDIEDVDSVEEMADERRYLFQNGTIGYVPQFGGLNGKNLVFTNSSLSGDSRFPFDSQFSSLTGDASVKLYESFTKDLTDGDSNTVYFSKFIDVARTDGIVEGVLVDSTNKDGYYVPTFAGSGSIVKFGNISGRSIYDVSNTSSKFKLIADGEDSSMSIGAFSCETNAPVVNRLPVFGDEIDDFSTDFKTFDEVDDDIYAFHSNGDMVSRLSVSPLTGDVFDSGFIDVDNDEEMKSDLISRSYAEGSYGIQHSANSSVACVKTRTVVTDVVEKTGGTYEYIDRDTVVLSYFGAYGNKKAIQVMFADSDSTEETVKSIDLAKRIIPFTCGNVPMVLTYVKAVGDKDYYDIRRILEDGTVVEEHKVQFQIESDHKLIKDVIDTYSENTKVLYTDSLRAYVIEFSIENGEFDIKYTKTFDILVNEGKIDGSSASLDKFTLVAGQGRNYIHFAYYSEELDLGGLLYTRKDTPDSVGLEATFDVSDVKNITKVVSNGDKVLVEENYGGLTRIHLSVDDGRTFRLVEKISNEKTEIIGCFSNAFVVQYDNGAVEMSRDGLSWENVKQLIYSKWVAYTANGSSYAFCSKKSAEAGSSDNVNDYAALIDRQIKLDESYDGIAVSSNGIAVAYKGVDGTTTMKIAVIDVENGSFKTYTLGSVRGFSFNGCKEYNGSLFFAPNGGNLVLKIVNVFNDEFDGSVEFIDITNALGSSFDKFGGFAYLGNELIMYPSSGTKVLTFNSTDNKFYTYVTFGETCSFVDADEIIYRDNKTVIFTDSSSIKNKIGWTVITGVGRTDYAIVEIDEGYPILVTKIYNSSNDTYEFTFTFINDRANGRVTISTFKIDVEEEKKDLYTESTSKKCRYTVGNKSILYGFHTVDNTPKYVIEKNDETEEEMKTVTNDYLNVSYYLDDTNRDNAKFGYTSHVKNRYSVYRGFTIGELTPSDIYQREIAIAESGGTFSVELFKKYKFTSTVSLSGLFDKLFVSDASKGLIKNSNLALSDHTNVVSASGMFKDCKNARFDSEMAVSGNVLKNTDSMFENCANALLPEVDLSRSSIESANAMFRNCGSASLNSVKLPNTVKSITEMFKNCSSANLYEVQLPYGEGVSTEYSNIDSLFEGCVKAELGGVTISPTVTSTYRTFKNCHNAGLSTVYGIGSSDNCREMFYGCTKAAFKNFTFEEPSSKTHEYDFGYMFYNCNNFNPNDINFEAVAPYVVKADHMFSGIGYSNVDMLNNRLYKFMKMTDMDGIFEGASLAMNGTCFQFYGKNGFIDIDTGTRRNCTVKSLSSIFGDKSNFTKNVPRIILSDNDDITFSNVDTMIDKPLSGHYSMYMGSCDNGILDFTGIYKDTLATAADIRGICNNIDLFDAYNEKDTVGIQIFDSMFENCKNITEIKGYIPPYVKSCKAMFKGCSKLSVDISELFRKHTKDFESTYDTEKAFDSNSYGKFYNFLDISHMFEGCKSVYTYDDNFDLARILDSVVKAHELNGTTVSERHVKNAFAIDNHLAMQKSIDALHTAVYDPSNVAKNGIAIHYATTTELMKKYSPSSKYMKWIFKNGFYRYCGTFPSDPNRHFSVIYYPVKNASGEIIKLEPKHGKISGLTPEGFQTNYSSHDVTMTKTNYGYGYYADWWWYGWYENVGWWWSRNSTVKATEYDYWSFDYKDVYAAEITDMTNGKKSYSYVGEYKSIHNWRVSHIEPVFHRELHGWDYEHWWWYNYWTYNITYTYYSDSFDMPLTVFVGQENTITPIG